MVFMTNNNVNLTDYILERAYAKNDSFSKDEINSLLEGIRNQEVEILEIVLDLPTTNIKSNKLYLKYNGGDKTGNLFDIFLYINGEWEQLDGLNFSISDYYTQTQMDNLLQSKASSRELTNTKESLIVVRDNLSNLHANLTKFNEALIEFNEDDETLSEDLSLLKDNLENFLDRVNGLIDGVTELETQLGNEEEGTGLVGELRGTQSELRVLQEDLTGEEGLSNNLSTLRHDLDETTQSLHVVEEDITSLQEEDTRLTGELNNLGTALNGDGTDENKGLIRSLSETQTTVSELDSELITTKSTLTTTQGLVTATQEDVRNLQSKDLELEGQLDSLDVALNGDDSVNPPIKGLSSSLSETKGDLSDLRDELETTKGVLDTTNDTLSDTSAQLSDVKSELLGDDYPNTTGGLKKDLTDLSSSVGSLNTEITGLKTADAELQQGINGLSVELIGDESDPNDTGGLRGELSSINILLNGDENDEDDTGLRGQLITLQSQTGAMNVNLTKLTDGLFNTEGELKVTGDQIIIFSQELDEFIQDLGTLGESLSNFEGSLTEFKEQNKDIELNTFALDSSIVDLFAIIGSVRSDVTSLDNTINDEENGLVKHIGDVQDSLYGEGGNSDNYSNNSLLGQIDTVQGDITTINETTIPNVESSIQTVDGKVATAKGRIDTIVNTTIPSVQGQIETVDGRVDSVNEVIGNDGSNGESKTGLYANIDTVDSRVTSVDEKIGDNTKGLVKQINTARNDIDTANSNITRVEGKVDSTQEQLDESIESIQTVNNLLNGGIIEEIHPSNSYTEYTVDTSSLKGEFLLRLLANDDNNYRIRSLEYILDSSYTGEDPIVDFEFNEGLTYWNPSVDDNTKINVSNNCVLSLNNKDNLDNDGVSVSQLVDFTYIESITYEVKCTVNTDTRFYILVGDNGVLNHLTEFNSTLENFDEQLSILDDGLTDANNQITIVDGKVDTARRQLNESLEYINNVQKIVYGDNTYYYTCNEQEWSEYTIDTTELTGILYVKFLVYPINNILLKEVSVVSNGDFSQGLTNWNVTNNTNITVEDNICRLNSTEQVMILTHPNVDFSNVDSISFKVMADDEDPDTDMINGLFVYLGDEEENTGLLETLTNFTTRLNRTKEDLTDAVSRIHSVENTIGDENTGIIKQINDTTDEIDRVDGRIDGTVTYIGNAVTEINNTKIQVNNVKTSVYGKIDGSSNDYTSNSLYGNIDTVQSDISDVQDDITTIDGMIGTDTTPNTIKYNIKNAQEGITTANGYIEDLQDAVGNVDVVNDGSLQAQVEDINNDIASLNTGVSDLSSSNLENTKIIQDLLIEFFGEVFQIGVVENNPTDVDDYWEYRLLYCLATQKLYRPWENQNEGHPWIEINNVDFVANFTEQVMYYLNPYLKSTKNNYTSYVMKEAIRNDICNFDYVNGSCYIHEPVPEYNSTITRTVKLYLVKQSSSDRIGFGVKVTNYSEEYITVIGNGTSHNIHLNNGKGLLFAGLTTSSTNTVVLSTGFESEIKNHILYTNAEDTITFNPNNQNNLTSETVWNRL